MRTLKIVAALALLAMPNSSYGAALAGNIGAKLQPLKKASAPLMQLAANEQYQQIPSNSMMVPTLSELNDQIDKGNEAAPKKPLPSLKLPVSTRAIMGKLPPKLNRQKDRASKKGRENLKSNDFTGTADKTRNINVNVPERTDATNTGWGDPASVTGRKAFQLVVKEPAAKSTAKEQDVLALASRAYAVGQYESAIALYKAALQKDPSNHNALFGIATSYHRAGQRNQAKVYYSKLLTKYPYDAEGQNNFLTLVSEESPREALIELDKLAKANPKYGAIYAQKAMIYIKMGDDNVAMTNLYQALQLEPQDNNYKYNLAVLFDKNGYYENAALLYDDLIDQSRRGIAIPVNKTVITDRMTYIKAKIKNSDEKKPF